MEQIKVIALMIQSRNQFLTMIQLQLIWVIKNNKTKDKNSEKNYSNRKNAIVRYES